MTIPSDFARRSRLRQLVMIAFCAVIALLRADASRAAETIDFDRDVRRILSENCFKCHGPDAHERKGGKKGQGLRLDTPDGAQADLGGHSAIVPGHPEKSELIRRITTEDPDDKMPPPKSGKKLAPQEMALLESWIKQGARYAVHWAYVKPHRSALPDVRHRDWPENPIDFFILARLEAEGLEPAPEADRYALARRVALDLTGLPPTPEEVEAFVNDEAPGAYSRWVDRLLAKDSFGEHWARLWLDQARYADSSGYADDPPRTIWAYRDYVIRALNANKSFDQFTIEQLAGDLLPDPTDEQLIATAFHRNTLTNNEGGTNDEEFRNVAVVDRVNTTMAVWMGTTMGCAQCHDHKYDPLKQEEYFRLFAILNNTEDADRGDETPVLKLFTEKQKRQRQQWQNDIARLEKVTQIYTLEMASAQTNWEKSFANEPKWEVIKPASVSSKAGAAVTQNEDGTVRFERGGKTDVYTFEVPFATNQTLAAIRLETLPDDRPPGGGVGHANGNFVITHVRATITPPGENPVKEASKPASEVAGKGARDLAFEAAYADYEQKDFPAARVLNNDDPKTKGWAIGPQFGATHTLTLSLKSPWQAAAGSKLTLTIEQLSKHEYATVAQVRLSSSPDSQATEFARTPPALLAIIRTAPDHRTTAQQDELKRFYLSITPALKAERDQLASLKKQLNDLKPYTTVPVLHELRGEQRRKTNIQRRGNFLDLGKEVTAGLPAAFNPTGSGANLPNRLTLAKWLVSPENPLTARVAANRFWESIFGIGIVRTSEEFGAQGERPSHPELLDWLATEFMETNWDMKHLPKLMVTSATYRQSSRVTPELIALDPDNRLLARGPRFRLSAETIRDQAMFVSGLLSPKMYGPPVKPLQPKMGVSAAFGSGIDWETSSGEDRYRRALYTMWRRSNPYPSMATFDAPNREVCTVRRERSNTPLQALVTLNDPVYVEAAQALARRMIQAGSSPADKARYGFYVSLCRPPSDKELTDILQLYEKTAERFARDPEKARHVAGTTAVNGSVRDPEARVVAQIPTEGGGSESDASQSARPNAAEMAAWTVVGNVLLNLDEIFMKR